MVRGWRFDNEQQKWRGRGKGILRVFRNGVIGEVRMVFRDVKHGDKVRLLQRISPEHVLSKCDTNGMENEVEWQGYDYSMRPDDPLCSLWKMKFYDEPQKATEFMRIYNDAIDSHT